MQGRDHVASRLMAKEICGGGYRWNAPDRYSAVAFQRADYLVIWIGEKEQHATNTSETIEDGSHMSWIQFIIYDINV